MTPYSLAILSSPVIGDVHPIQSGVEVSFGTKFPRIHLRRGVNADNINPWPDTTTGASITSSAIGHIDGDNNLDIITATNGFYLYAHSHSESRITPYPLPFFNSLTSPVLGDINGDRRNETVVATADGYLHVLKNTDSRVAQYSVEWPQFHHDYQHTGVFGWVGGLLGGDANPSEFSNSTTLSFSLESSLSTRVDVYDAEGNLVRALVDQNLPSGTHQLVWNGRDFNLAQLPNGTYNFVIAIQGVSKTIPVKINR